MYNLLESLTTGMWVMEGAPAAYLPSTRISPERMV